VAFTVIIHTTGTLPSADAFAEWLTHQGEPFEYEGPQHLGLRGLPVRMIVEDGSHEIQAQIDVDPNVPIMRLVDLLFDLSVVAGADVRLAGIGSISRPELWMRLADDQDRQRIARALDKASEHGNHEEVIRRLWAILNVLSPNKDVRWSAEQNCIVEMREIGAEGGISVEEARWHIPDASIGDLIATKLPGFLHSLAWRWLSEAYPALNDTRFSLGR